MPVTPTWTWKPNWQSPVLERIEFQTGLLTGTLGHVQALAHRVLPRRSVEASFTLLGAERTALALSLQRLGAVEWRIPLWFDSARLTAGAAIGATTLALDTSLREYTAGGFAFLPGPDCFGGETVEINTVAADHITLAAPLEQAWAAGSRIHPCKTAWLNPNGLSGLTGSVGIGAVRFNIDTDTEYDVGVETAPTYQGYPILQHRPNWAQQISTDFERELFEFDPGQGRRFRSDPPDRAFMLTRYSMLFDSFAEKAAFRSLLYRLRGQQKPLWVPSFNDDIRMVSGALSGDDELLVERCGFGLVGGVSDDIADVLISRNLPVRISTIAAPPDPSIERLVLDDVLPRDVAAGERGSLLSLSRLDQDVITLTHVTDEVATAPLTWKTFTPGRDGTAVGHQPIPETEMNDTPCGVEGGICVIQFQAEVDAGLIDDPNMFSGLINVPLNSGTSSYIENLPQRETTEWFEGEVGYVRETLRNQLIDIFYVYPDGPPYSGGFGSGGDYYFRVWSESTFSGLPVSDPEALASVRLRWRKARLIFDTDPVLAVVASETPWTELPVTIENHGVSGLPIRAVYNFSSTYFDDLADNICPD